MDSFKSDTVKRDILLYKRFYSKAALTSHDNFLWSYIVQMDNCSDIIFRYLQKYPELAHVKDADNRACVDIATESNRKVIQSQVLWFGKYKPVNLRAEHASATCLVYKAIDESSPSKEIVALKFMGNKNNYFSEINYRKDLNLHSDYVMHILESYVPNNCHSTDYDSLPLNIEIDTNQFLTKTKAECLYCIVMPFADRNMYMSMKHERFAGKNMEEVKHVFVHISQCVHHLHQKGLIHGDIKTLNIMRCDSIWKLIDLDGSCRIGEFMKANKCSTAYSAPEALCAIEDGKIIVRSSEYNSTNSRCELLVAHPSYDVWSLGCILYQLCNSQVRALFEGGRDDSLRDTDDIEDDNTLGALHRWDPYLKKRKLDMITDSSSRNLISQMLNKDPSKRPTISQILNHPFLSGKSPARMLGEPAKYDVFISYRVASDYYHACMLYSLLKSRGLNVFFDKISLQAGVPWEDGFCNGLTSSKAFVPIISRSSINEPDNKKQNFTLLTHDSPCDNVLLEYRLALELRHMGMIDFIYPIMIGDIIITNTTMINNANRNFIDSNIEILNENIKYFNDIMYGNYFTDNCAPLFTDLSIVVKSVEEKLCDHLDRQALGCPYKNNMPISTIVSEILSNQGGICHGRGGEEFVKISNMIYDMIHDPSRQDHSHTTQKIARIIAEKHLSKGNQMKKSYISTNDDTTASTNIGIHQAAISRHDVVTSILADTNYLKERLKETSNTINKYYSVMPQQQDILGSNETEKLIVCMATIEEKNIRIANLERELELLKSKMI
jgi:serine/threonine protein kinase